MHGLLCFFLLITPVLYEGRFRPLETVPEGANYAPLEVKNYSEIAGSVYLKAEGKALKYPTVSQLKAELLLHHIPFKWLIISCYIAAAALLLSKLRIAWGFFAAGLTLHTVVLGLRCYVLMRPPVSNMSETILYVPWIAILVGLIFRKKALLASLISATVLLLFLPTRLLLENVQAVLDSQYWLIIHVLMVVGSYGVFCVSAVCSHLFLFKNSSYALEKTIIQTLYLGTILLICGTVLGGVWAAESWGRFWDWDPKEAWAFISSGVYLMCIHAYRFKKIGGRGLAIGAIIGFMAITFTWYGVNYILGSGLHSYGFGNGGEIFYYLFLVAEIIFLLSTFLFYKKSHD